MLITYRFYNLLVMYIGSELPVKSFLRKFLRGRIARIKRDSGERYSLIGTATFNGGAGNVAHTYFVIVNGGQSSMQIQTDASYITTNFVQK